MKVKRRLWTWVFAVLAVFSLVLGWSTVALADEISAPATNKTLYDNGDGSYTLSLSVTGTAASSSESDKANVVIILDVSGSMDFPANTAGQTNANNQTVGRYGVNNNSIWRLYYQYNGQYYPEGTGPQATQRHNTVYYRGNVNTYSNFGNGQRYNYTNNDTRLDVAKRAVNDLIDTLSAQNSSTDDMVEITLVTFSTDASANGTWYSGTDMSALKGIVSGAIAGGGTNWDDALYDARQVNSAHGQTDETTYVVFFSDGDPTYSNTTNNNDSATSHTHGGTSNAGGNNGGGSTQAREYNAAYYEANQLHNAGAKLYSIYAFGSNQTYMQTVTSYGNYGNSSTTVTGTYFFTANDDEEIEAAFAKIANSISNAINVDHVDITDQITGLTATTLVNNATDFKYYRAGSNADHDYGTFNPDNGEYGTSWTPTADGAKEATFTEGAGVEWNLGDSFKLEDGITYTVTFTVWPSQAAYDLVADLNNGIKSYDSLTPDEKAQVVRTQTGGTEDDPVYTYSVKTNPDGGATINYNVTDETNQTQEPTDSKGNPITWSSAGTYSETVTNDDGSTTKIDYKSNADGSYTITKTSTPKDPVVIDNPSNTMGLTKTELELVKLWEDSLDPSQREDVGKSIVLDLYLGNDVYLSELTLTEESHWTHIDTVTIAPGIMVDNTSPAYNTDPAYTHVTLDGKDYVILETGHDYYFKEEAIDGHFELTNYIYHPMLINGTLYNVEFEKSGDTITGVKAVKAMAEISATNTLKGGINITKVVKDETGADYNDPNPFTVTVTVTDPDGNALPEKTASDGTKYTIDYRIYYGPNNPKYGTEGTSETLPGGRSGHIYATGTSFTETIYVGDTIRVVNVEDDSLYTVTETVPTGYDPDYTVTYLISEGTADNPQPFPEGEDPSVQGNSASFAEVTNKFVYGDLEVSKVVEVESGDEEQAKAQEFTFTFHLYTDSNKTTELTGNKYSYTKTAADGTTSTGTIEVGGTFTLKDGETYKIDKLPETAYYEVVETAVEGFETEADGDTGTIVAKQTAEAEFTNTYSVEPVSVDPPVKKNLTVEEGVAAPDIEGKFTFAIENTQAPEGVTAPMPENTSITNSDEYAHETVSDAYEFGEITFTEPGTYVYKVTESGTVSGVTNDPEPKTITFTVTDEGDGTLTVSPTTDSAVFEFTNIYKTGDLTVSKTVVSEVVSDATRAFNFTVTLSDTTISGTFGDMTFTNGVATFTLTDGQSKTASDLPEGIDYTVTEVEETNQAYTVTKTGDTGTISSTEDATAAFTNTRVMTEVPVVKYWADEDYFVDGEPVEGYKRPDITIHLLADGTEVSSTTLTGATAADVTEWTYTFTNLPKYTDAGVEIVYSVTEDVPAGYEDAYETSTYIVNTPKEEDVLNPVELTIKKVDAETGNVIPTGATFTISPAPGEDLPTTYTTGEDGTVTIKFEKDGEYTLTETEAPEGYQDPSGSYTITVEREFVEVKLNTEKSVWQWIYDLIFGEDTQALFDEGTNTLTVENPPLTTRVAAEKVWEDNDDQDGVRPDSIELQLLADDEEVGEPKTLDDSSDWSCAWEQLPAYADGELIEYTVDEVSVTGYTTEITYGGYTYDDSYTIGDGYTVTVTNTHDVEKTKVTVTKVWNDNDDEAGLRPESITVNLLADGAAPTQEGVEATQTLTGDDWTYTWEDLDVFSGGKAIAYSVDEVKVDNYATYVGETTGNAKDGFEIEIDNSNITIPTDVDTFFKKSVTVPNPTSAATFSFTIAATDPTDAPMPPSTTGTASYAAGETGDKTIDFGEVTYTEAGTYTYTITEAQPADGWTATGSPATVTVTVTGSAAEGFEATAKGGSISNAYAAEGEAQIVAKKVAEGFDLEDGQFEFELKDSQGTVLQTKANDANGDVVFDAIEYTAPGTYTYTITEVIVEGDDIADDTHVCNVTVTVVDNGDGTLSATATYDNNTFTNTHDDNEKTVVSGKAETYVDGELVEAGDTLTYTITYANNTSGEATVTVTDEIPSNTTYVEGSATNGGVYADGTITWTIEKVAAGATGSVSFEVTVDDAAAGTTLENTGLVDDGENQSSTNSVTTSVPVKDVKDESGASIDGEGVQVGDELTYEVRFTLTEAATDVTVTDAIPEHTTLVDGSISNGGTVTDGTITWDLGELEAGDYTVTFKVTVDESAVTVDAITNTASISVNNHSEVKTNTVTNTPETGNLTVSKTVTVPEGYEIDEDAEFTFTVRLWDKTEAELAGEYKYTGSYEGTIKSGDTVTLKHGESITIAGLPAGGLYEVTETKVDGYTPTPSEKISGTIASGEAVTAAFENVYKTEPVTATPEATKIAEGFDLEAEQFSFELKDADGKVLQTKKNAADGKVAFDALNFTKPGTYTYTISEVIVEGDDIADDTHVCNVTVTVTDEGDGTLSAELVYDNNDNTFTNTHDDNVKEVYAGTTETKVDGELVGAGDILTYTISYANNTEGVATVTVEDTIPANTTYVEGSADPAATFDGSKLTWTIEGVAAGATGTVTFQVQVDDTAKDVTIENTGKVNDGQNDSSTNAVTTSVPVKDVKDSSGASIDGDGVKVGDTLTYEVGFTLTEDATSVVVTDDVPANTTLVDGSIDNGGSVSGGTITWDLGALPAGDYTVSFQVTVDESAVTVDAITNTASISVNNHSDVKTNTVTNTPEIGGLTVSKTISVPAGYEIDEDAEFTFTISLTDKNGAELTGKYAYTGDYEGELTNGSTFTLKHGESITIAGLPAGAKYSISEAEVAGYTPAVNPVEGEISADETAAVEAAFENVYNTEPAEVDPPVQKVLDVPGVLDGPESIEGAFTFTIENTAKPKAVESAPMPANTSIKNSADYLVPGASDLYEFGAIEFTVPGDYVYTVTESGSVPGVTNDPQNAKTITVHVKDDGSGKLTATMEPADAKWVFTNTYDAEPIAAEFEVKKDLTGTPLTAGAFEFELKSGETVLQTKTNDADGKVAFDEITYDEPGTYTYTITEIDGGKGGYGYDDKTITVTVIVTDDTEGHLVAEVKYDPTDTTFINTYEASGEFTPTAKKTLEGRELEEGQFTFELLDQDGNVIQTKTNNASGAVQFDPISYDQTIFVDEATTDDKATTDETEGTEGDITGAAVEDEATAEATTDEATVEDATDEAVTEDVATDEVVADEAAEVEAAEVEATEVEATTEDEDFSIADAVSDLGNFIGLPRFFAPTIAWAEEAGEPEAEEVAEPRSKTFTYTIREVNDGKPGYTYDEHEVTITVTVEDDGEGKLIATPVYSGDTEFVNTYEAEGEAQFNGIKTVTGIELKDGQFSFELKDAENNVLETVTNGADGSFAFNVIAYDEGDAGKSFTYTIVEVNDGQKGYTYDSHVCDVTVDVTDNGDGTLTCAVSYGDGDAASFTNPYKPLPTYIPLTATKEMTGRDLKADEFTFELTLPDGSVVKATNAADGTVNFGVFEFSEPGTYTFTAKEVKGTDANVTYDESVKTFTVEVLDENGQLVAAVTNPGEQVFKNKYTEPPAKKRKKVLPQTSDDSMPTSVVIATGIAGASLVAAGLSLRLRKDED